LSPEFLNRIDEVLVYKKLNSKSGEQIVSLLMEELNKRLHQKGIKLEYPEALIKYLAKKGFSEEYGARNLKRTISEEVENKLAEFLLKNNLMDTQKKNITIEIRLIKNNLEFSTKRK
jgi:ATP-dependent Clp protease ATP-binding subunit ClpA